MKETIILNPAMANGTIIAQTLKAQYGKNNIKNFVPRHGSFAANAVRYTNTTMNSKNIRKLTPSETLRLMDMDESNIQKIVNAKDEKGKQLVSDTHIYAATENGIVTACLEGIFHNLFIGIPANGKADNNGQLSLYSRRASAHRCRD